MKKHTSELVAGKWYVYTLMLDGVVVYVGQSVNILTRMGCHSNQKEFTGAEYFPCDGKKEANNLEAELIVKHKPPQNTLVPRNDIFKSKSSVLSEIEAILVSAYDRVVPPYVIEYRHTKKSRILHGRETLAKVCKIVIKEIEEKFIKN